MGFLRNMFRRKSSSDNNSTSPTSTSIAPTTTNDVVVRNNSSAVSTSSSTARKNSWRNNNSGGNAKGTKAQGSGLRSQGAIREDSPTQVIVDDIAFIPPSINNGSRRALRGPDESDGTQRPILSPRNVSPITNTTAFANSINNQSKGVLKLKPHSTPVDLDDSRSESMSESAHSRSHVTSEEKTRESDADLEQPPLSNRTGAPIFSMPDSNRSSTTMLPKLRFSAGNVSVGSEDTDGESSSFNISTDAEDTEYEAMRRRLGAVTALNNNINSMDMSVANYTTDGETSVFPGLNSEDDMTQTTASVTKEASQHSILHLPTVNPATGASLVPVGYSTSNNHPYAGSAGFPGATAYKSTNDSLSNKQKEEATDSSNIGSRILKPKDDPSNNSRFSKPQVDDNVDEKVGGTTSRHRMDNNVASKSSVPTLESSKRDSPDPKVQRSPNGSKPVVSTNNNSSFTQYNPNFMEAMYGSPTVKNNKSTSNHQQQQQQQQPQQRRSFTSPKNVPTVEAPTTKNTTTAVNFDPFTMDNTTGFTTSDDMDLFADFADFSNFDSAFNTMQQQEQQPSASVQESSKATAIEAVERVRRTAASPFIDRPDEKARTTRHTSIGSTTSNGNDNNHQRSSMPISSSSNGSLHNDTSLSELLEKAKSKSSRSNSGNVGKKSSTSVNSAPAHMTASYLRQHHNLGKSRSSKGEGASVTDIIQSLEAANATRLTSGSSRSLAGGRHSHPTTGSTGGGSGNISRDDGFSSAHSREGGSSVMSARERMRRRRERRHQRGGDAHSSNSDDEHEENESWLFDEVTGALGPRGIAADLESLSGRSNRSSSSRGNKSHRSHRSHKSGSRSSRHRRPKTDSADSVDSHHSRDSRRSRGSRYSQRSTRSYISQMSEQSRSVANDLLRLEMQLAMVGSSGVPGLEGGNGSVGGITRSSRSLTSRTTPPVTGSSVPATTSGASARRIATARRSRITIQAPPGRLGIILANKADSRGTVVSGVRTNSALADRISPGDRIVAIDGEDVSLMTVSEITIIMARKADFERTLTVLTTPRHSEPTTTSTSGINSPRSSGGGVQQHRTSYRG